MLGFVVRKKLHALTPDPSPTAAGEGRSNFHGGLVPPRLACGRGG